MKKLQRITTIVGILPFFLNFITYQTSRMKAPSSFGFFSLMLGKTFTVNGVSYTSPFNLEAMLAFVFALLAIAGAWLLKDVAMRIVVGGGSLASIVLISRAILMFTSESSFVQQLNTVVKNGVEFKTNLFFAVIIVMLLLNLILCFTTENFAKNMIRYKWFFLMVLPSILFFVVFAYIPMVGISIVFMDFNIADMWSSTWAGFKWFAMMGQNLDGEFGQVIVNTLVIAFGKLLIGFPAPIILALMFNECRNVGLKRTVQTLSYLPYFISWSIVGGLVIALFSSDFSVVNGIIHAVTGDMSKNFYLLNENDHIRMTLILSNMWKGVGWGTVIYLAALSGVNPEIYESARLDGASRLKQIWYITLPGISHIITLQLILTTPNLISDNFDQSLNMVYPLAIESGKTLSMYIYQIGIRGSGTMGMGGNYSYSTAIGLCNSVLALLLLVVANQIGKRINEEGAVW